MHAIFRLADSEKRLATYEDLLALPPHVTGQIVAGVLHTFPRGRYLVEVVHTGRGRARPRPFDPRELDLATLWGR